MAPATCGERCYRGSIRRTVTATDPNAKKGKRVSTTSVYEKQ
jgi:hypothetical protein